MMNKEKKTYLIRSVTGSPDWSTVPQLQADRVLWKPDCGVRAFGQFCHDSECLFVHLRAIEANIRAEYTTPLSPVCGDSCLEFFFMPEAEKRYFNFEVNPNGCLWIGFGHSRADSTVLYRSDMEQFFNGLRPTGKVQSRMTVAREGNTSRWRPPGTFRTETGSSERIST